MTAERKAALLELRDRLAKATGPGRKADALLARLVGRWVFDDREAIYPWRAPDAVYHMTAPPYTASLDSAVTLRPEGWRLRNMQEADPNTKYMPATAELIPTDMSDEVWSIRERAGRKLYYAHPTSLPLAICLARIEYELAKEGQP